MAYIGKEPIVGNFQKCDAITVVNGQAAYTLQVGSTNVSPESVNHMIVSLNGVIQAPTTAYTVSGATLTFDSNLATGDVIDFVLLLGNVLDIGTPSDDTVATAKIQDDAVTLAKMASGTDGNIISYDASGNPVAIATGSDGQVLTSTGAGSPPAFEAAAAGGKILQVVSGSTTTASASTSTSFVDSGLNVAITPAASSSKILVICKTNVYQDTNGASVAAHLTLERQISGGSDTELSGGTEGLSVVGGQDGRGFYAAVISTLDSPSTTSAVTYEMQYRGTGGSLQVSVNHHSAKSEIIAIEVGA